MAPRGVLPSSNSADLVRQTMPSRSLNIQENGSTVDWTQNALFQAAVLRQVNVEDLATMATRIDRGALQDENGAAMVTDKEGQTFRGIGELASKYNLTKREQDALRGVSLGLSNKQLAERMNISPNTVKAFLHVIMIKLGVTTRSEIAARIQLASAGASSGTPPTFESHGTGQPVKASGRRRRD